MCFQILLNNNIMITPTLTKKHKENWQSSFYSLLRESPATHFMHASLTSNKQENTEEAGAQFHEDILRLRKPMQLLGSRESKLIKLQVLCVSCRVATISWWLLLLEQRNTNSFL